MKYCSNSAFAMRWRHGVAVTSLGVSTKLLFVRQG